MKNVYLYSDDLYLIGRWMKLINANISIIENLEELEKLTNSILVINTSASKDISEKVLQNFINNQNKLMILDNTPNLLAAKKYLNLGAKAYGNTLMTGSYLNSSIEALDNDYIWLLPDITTKIMNEMISSNKTIDNEKTDYFFDLLTEKEKEIASFLKKGYTNSKISEEINISINTVKTHIKHIYEKLDVKDRLSFSSLFSK